MLRTYTNSLRKQAAQMFILARLAGTDASSTPVNVPRDKFAERAQENVYFRKISDDLLKQLRQRHSDLDKQSDNIEEEQEQIEEQIKNLENQIQQLIQKAQKPAKPKE